MLALHLPLGNCLISDLFIVIYDKIIQCWEELSHRNVTQNAIYLSFIEHLLCASGTVEH